MTSTGESRPSPWCSPEIAALLECLSRLDGKLRLITDRSGRVLVSSAEVVDHASRTTAQMLELAGIGPGASEAASRLLAVSGQDTACAIMPPSATGASMVARAAAVDTDHVCLVLAIPGQASPGRIEELQTLFALTPCEARIVIDLMEGLAPQTIAQNRSNSIHTIRAHIRQCHQKIGVSNREELFNRISIACS